MPRKRDIISKLKKARELIAAGWTQKVYHRPPNSFGNMSDVDCYCSIGGINKAVCGGATNSSLYPEVYDLAEGMYKQLAQAINGEVGNRQGAWHTIAKFNDQAVCKEEVLAMFDKAIAA